MSKVYIVRGPAASGKSSIAKELKNKKPDLVHIDIDSFKHLISKESSKERSEIAHRTSLVFLDELITHNYDVIVEEIFRPDFYRELLDRVEFVGAEVHQVHITAPLEVLLTRSRQREKSKGDEVIEKLFNEIKPLEGETVYDSNLLSIDEIVSKILHKS